MTRLEALLIRLSEEAVEVAQRVDKALLFGLKEIQPGQPYTNHERILFEIADFKAIFRMLYETGAFDILTNDIESHLISEKKKKVEKFLDYQRQLGILD